MIGQRANDDHTVAHLTGCPCGCPLDHHECSVGQPIRPAGYCHLCAALGVPELRLMGWRHGGCIHGYRGAA